TPTDLINPAALPVRSDGRMIRTSDAITTVCGGDRPRTQSRSGAEIRSAGEAGHHHPRAAKTPPRPGNPGESAHLTFFHAAGACQHTLRPAILLRTCPTRHGGSLPMTRFRLALLLFAAAGLTVAGTVETTARQTEQKQK